MTTKLLLTSLFALSVQQTVLAQTDANGYTTVNLSMGSSYQNRVFFDFSANNIVSQPANSWDVAFYRASATNFGTRINDAYDIKVYQASANPSDWNTITSNSVASYGAPLFNVDNTNFLQEGAFEQGSATYGWGEYNPLNHHVEGKVIFIMQYASGASVKFMIEDYFSGYTFKYAKWNAATSSWDATQTKTVANGSDDAYFNYFSFATGEKVSNLEPSRANWDMMFTRYYTDYPYTDPQGNPQTMKYRMSGVIQNSNITVAKVRPETQETATSTIPASNAFSSNITTIGHSWKPTSGVYSDAVYYVKQGSDYYRMYFISNEGTQTGNMYFKYKKITSTLGITEVSKKASFGIYPNPTTADKKVTVLFDVKEKANNKGSIEVYDLTGKKVHTAELTNQAGFYKQDLNLSHLTAGNYIVKITFGGSTETKKLIVK
ncbi:Por secretion system C-terminal sorting domain-containing protein [Chryseobacterium oleae]|uniref:Por secretion system C-terminal sorting domain-containing protein n=1 Tax=Chryseobacterium oleae TaxID=491207 RepID=A0A1I4XT44_CHROL|nr:T9SS type A sorting domain-containing protein [Chryseobacterium oleae]SFN28440.1 Por secretion system C-terminal sorting domain-containing protein [Chryseobacterium oleae]